ncbi:hypothetical protein BDZ91DRAFT_716876, partial [Kalaharituber pfeilii]
SHVPPPIPTKPLSDGADSKPRTPSSVANSSISFESLPPVPPLHINKIPPLAIKKESSTGSVISQQPRVTGLEQFYYEPSQSSRPSIYIDTVARKESSSSLRTHARNASSSTATNTLATATGQRPLPQQPQQPQLPKPILKRTNYIPPQTVDEYDERRTSWVERTLEQRYNYSRMNGRSLRIVRTSEEEEARDEFPEVISTPRAMSSGTPLSISPDLPGRQGVRKQRSFTSMLSRSDSVNRPGTAMSQQARPGSSFGIPSWARYFYAKGEVALPEDDDKAAGATVKRPEPALSQSRFGSLRRMASLGMSPQRTYEHEPADPAEVASRWSYPHLDRSTYPLSPVERMNRQLVLFCLGFILPFCWIIGALLPLPGPRPMWRAPIVSGDRGGYRVDVEASLNCTFKQERIFLSHEYWRKVNRMMSAVGVVLSGAIITLAIVAVKIS